MKYLELLAPARTKDIGIAAIDCGADAVYIAGPAFGARKAAGNSITDIAELCSYAHRFGARVFLTTNTIIYDSELDSLHSMMLEAQEAGVDAFIVQDLAITSWDDIIVPLHASTQCAIRTPEKAAWLSSMGFSRIVLERELSLPEIRRITLAGESEIEFFVHGALCVCYSGQCYMSECISGRSANRGECIQACRSLYDLVDAEGNILVRNKALLSLKDYNLKERLPDLAEAGVTSFKIEGRLKNISYVRNVVRQYSMALDTLVSAHPDLYARASFGTVTKGFLPAPDKTFNRGYTTLLIDGKRGRWSSMDAPKSMGESIGNIVSIKRLDRNNIEIQIKPSDRSVALNNGDGFSVVAKTGIIGFRGDVCEGMKIRCKDIRGLEKGQPLYRNSNAAFEKEMERNACKRELRVSLNLRIHGDYNLDFTARSEDGREVFSPFKTDLETAENKERAEAMIREQLSKRSGDFLFSLDTLEVETPGGKLPLMSASTLNSIRRLIASDLDAMQCRRIPMQAGRKSAGVTFPEEPSYKTNIANATAREALGIESCPPAYELEKQAGAELMRTRHCIKYELGLCSIRQGAAHAGPLFLVNNGRRFSLGFDCKNCEMTVSEA